MAEVNRILETKCISSLEKVFPDEELTSTSFNNASALINETYSFQVAYRNNQSLSNQISIEVESELQDLIALRSVGLAPSELPCYADHDDNILRATSGLYPDPLYSIQEDGLVGLPKQWRAIWVTVNLNDQVTSGIHNIRIVFKTEDGQRLGEEVFKLNVIPVSLPEQKLIHTEWFYADCLALEYNVEVFSVKHWELMDKYIHTAAKHGMNMIYTPLFTPPLDTEVGGERLTVQLIGVDKVGTHYAFDFSKLKDWIEMCKKHGIKYFEFSHFFTQWGAKHAPKIIANENDVESKIFGWDTDATGEEYSQFLSEFLPQLVAFIKEQDLEDYVYFHVSDEPTLEHLESYQKASAIVHKYLANFPIMDALSDYEFYEKGYVKHPIPANDHIEPFIENNVNDLWTYYCCVQYKDVSNRFFTFPSSRNRVIGLQLYKFNIKGFLHWGYNFWLTQYSKKVINPYENTDAGYAFASGDAFLVYPGEDGPIESVRLEVFYEALQDLRALELLENKIGKEHVVALLEKEIEHPITFKQYPSESEWLLEKREQINSLIAKEFVK
ncbi:hypothetical protein BN1058_01160 [Paraliobacillus sp. PM-2]|uniref:DUF4091 domain-containing protein n=1 Tax=Paraliobacillus sp. PM-2 TaxID=1462524 RepID=UPI00061BEE45|nr:DUF4091 domain-containing protein [Paraliobacillus sp. PM-2]CQR46876.1 hypothetical protein BN1058_01160 [Paraliobacillus sp. PM-2]